MMLISKQLVLVRELFLFTRVEAFILQRFLPFVHNKKNHRRFKIFAWLKKRGKITLFFLSETCECNTEGKITGRSDVASH